jgi:hypothetical protein
MTDELSIGLHACGRQHLPRLSRLIDRLARKPRPIELARTALRDHLLHGDDRDRLDRVVVAKMRMIGRQPVPDLVTVDRIPHIVRSLCSRPFDAKNVASYGDE